MTAAALTPRVRMMAICDGVRESRAEPGVFTLKRVRQSMAAQSFPFVPLQLWLFLLFTSSRTGKFAGYVRVVNDSNEKTIFYSYLRPPPSFNIGDEYCYGLAPLRCIFPHEGRYTVQVWFFQEEAVDVLKGELPFVVKVEGS